MTEERGYQTGASLASWTTLAVEANETNPDLVWPQSINIFDKMRREDAQVSSVLRAVTLPIRSARWTIDPAGAPDEVVDLVAADLGLQVKGRPSAAPLRTRGRFSWGDHLRMALLELPFGHSFFEQVYVVEGGRVHLAKLAWRPPRSISKIVVARDGGLEAIEQRGISGPDIRIPADRLVAYVNDREGANWLGQSIVRSAYKNWLLKDRELRAQALTIERNGLGVPVYTGAELPENMDADQREKWLESEKTAGLKIATGFRAGEAAGASIPPKSKLELIGVTGKLPDTDGPIRYHDEQIARAVLAHFLNLGTETGSWALGSTFANFFTDSLNAVADHIADITQQHVIEDLVDANWGPEMRAPRLVFEPIGSEHPVTAEAIKALIESKAIHPDESLEAFMRTAYGLPVRDAADGSEPDTTDADRARAAVEAVQKVYLGVGVVLSESEARELVRRAGADITGPLVRPAPTVEPPEGT